MRKKFRNSNIIFSGFDLSGYYPDTVKYALFLSVEMWLTFIPFGPSAPLSPLIPLVPGCPSSPTGPCI